MKKRFHFWSIVVCIAFVLNFLFSGCRSKIEKNSTPLILATYTYSTNNRIANLKPLSKELARRIDRPIEVKSYPNVQSLIKGIKSNKVDIGFINTLGYLLLSLDDMNMKPIAALKAKDSVVNNYKTVLLASRKRVPLSLDYLQKNSETCSMTFVAEGSTSGNLIPRLFLSSIGIPFPEEQFKDVVYAGDHKASLAKLLKGETDICALGSNEYFKQLKKDSTISESTSLLWISSEIPLGPVLVNKEIRESEKENIINLLSNLHETHPEILNAVKDGWSEAKQAEKFLPISDMHYDGFRRINGNSSNLSEILDFFTSHLLD
ncbi:MAG: PhnD/SsuA/transferrin family substrate-binding protein [Bacteroidota bacterium]